MKNFQRLHVAVAALGVLCLLALSSVLGRGLAPLSPVPATISAGGWLISRLYTPGQGLKHGAGESEGVTHGAVPEAVDMCAGAVVCLAAWLGISRLLKRFHFIGYNHSEK